MANPVRFEFKALTEDNEAVLLKAISGRFTLAVGVEPSVAEMNIPLSSLIPAFATHGTMTISDGNNTVEFLDCRTIRGNITVSDTGVSLVLSIRDRRWRWGKTGFMSGEFNRQDTFGKLIGPTLTLSELLDNILTQLGEVDSSLVDIPTPTLGAFDTFARPWVSWNFTRASDALRELTERYDLVVALTIKNKIKIMPRGKGETFPISGFTSQTEDIDVIDVPQSIGVIGSFHVNIEDFLEAVVKDVVVDGEDPNFVIDSKIVPINDASYFSTVVGYNEATWKTLKDKVGAGANEIEKNRLISKFADESLFRWYRLPSPLTIGLQSLTRAEYAPLWQTELDRKVQTDITTEQGARQTPIVKGAHSTLQALKDPSWVEDIENAVDVSFTIDRKLGLIKFSQPVFSFNKSTRVMTEPSTLKLLSVFKAPSISGLDAIFEIELSVSTNSFFVPQTGVVDILFHPEIIYNADEEGVDLLSPEAANTEPVKLAKAKAEERILEYQNDTRINQFVFAGIAPVSPDGIVQEITWEAGSSGPVQTIVSEGGEHATNNSSRKWRKFLMRQSKIGRDQAQRETQGFHVQDENLTVE